MPHEFTGGTFCSGTDCPVQIWEAFVAIVQNKYCATTSFTHELSCENVAAKQEFLTALFPSMKCLFNDALDVAAERAVDVKTGSRQPVPKTSWVAAGFPCDDASGLHPRSSTASHRMCVAEAGVADLSSGLSSTVN